MDPKIGSPNDESPERLAVISSFRTNDPSASESTTPPSPQPTKQESSFTHWSPTNNSTLPTFSCAHTSFHNLNGPHLLTTFIGPLFKTWNATSTFGVSLLYRAIPLPPDSKAVSRSNTLTAWPQTLHQSFLFTDRIREVAWRLVHGRWMAYELAFDGATVGSRSLEQASGNIVKNELQGFLDAFAELLVEYDLQDVLGLRALPDDDFKGWVEVSPGEVALRFVPDEQTEDWDDGAEECAWFFHGEYLQQNRTCRRYVALSTDPQPEPEDSESGSTDLKPDIVKIGRLTAEPEPKQTALMDDDSGSSLQEPEIEDFHATLRRFSNTMVVEDIEVLENGDLRFHGRSAEMPQRPKSR